MKTDMGHKKDMTSKQEQDIVVFMNDKNKILEMLKKLNGWQNNQKEIDNIVKLKKRKILP